ILKDRTPDVICNATGFATGAFGNDKTEDANPFRKYDCPVLQVVFSGTGKTAWQESPQGLPARDLAMNVVLPELDGRIMTRAVSFKADHHFHKSTQCRIITYEPVKDRTDFTAELAARWARLRGKKPKARKLAIILANYPNRDGRIGNGVGYDTPASTIAILKALKDNGYDTGKYPQNGNALIRELQSGPTNAGLAGRPCSPCRLDVTQYLKFFVQLPEMIQQQVTQRWGAPQADPFVSNGQFHLPARRYGRIIIAIQPARGYNIDPAESYHDPALVPPHGYLAFYFWLREVIGIDAIIHNGKHGNLEWLPGKAVGLSRTCYPEIALGPVPQLYPFIVNDPGEGTQAKRRTSAVIISHLTPPLARAETYGPLCDLEALIDEYYLASGLDKRRLQSLARQIIDLTQSTGLDEDVGLDDAASNDEKLIKLDTYICELKEAQIRDGLHILGTSPEGDPETALLVALARVPRNSGKGGDQSLIRALATDLGLDGFDPLDCQMGEPWQGPRPAALKAVSSDLWRSTGDTIERLELLALKLVSGKAPEMETLALPATASVLKAIETKIRPALKASGANEIASLIKGLDGRFVDPGPSGAPTRGRLDVLPAGKNFYSVDNRAIPTPTAWMLGEKSAAAMLTRHFQENGVYPKAIGLSVWGTSNMRTGGDDIAQALALIGAKPVWDTTSWRVTGFEIIPLAKLARPRVDVTLRISGFFRDAFPAQIELFDKATRAIGALDEPDADNPVAARIKAETGQLTASGLDAQEAARLAGQRIFGSKPGAYGAGLQALIDEKLWAERKDLAAAYIAWGAYAYGAGATGKRDEAAFTRRLAAIEAVVHNQDNREHDLLDSDDYYQFEGGMSAAVEAASGARPVIYHNDHSRPERPVTRTLEEEIGRVVRARAVNPKWIAGVKRHGYKGASEIAATVDYLFAFAATTGAVKSHHFDLAFDAYLKDEETCAFLRDNNPEALREIAGRFSEALSRGLWTPRSNSAYLRLNKLMEKA
ncbi:MAG TPA: cobaltochelatase subunit CobN, partial [Rhizobiales bacterium]|nr:cobaltochelatase subunit CobN [Hyphomicrobiales bacterium]